MTALPAELRKRLSKVVADARRQAELGARQALERLAVRAREPHQSMTDDERALRRRLRAHGRQLGDRRDRRTGEQRIERLTHEVAYEHWHQMLFARFLAENDLLIEPESQVPVTLAECEELAQEQGKDAWSLAGTFAARMLPRIFRPDDPVLEVTLAPETRQVLRSLLNDLPAKVFTSDDALGWTYQFWQAERKDEINASGVKIGADQLSPVTQLFTEHYMVRFLFHNTIGAWWVGKILASQPALAERAASESELRAAARLTAVGGYDFDYLRFVRQGAAPQMDDAPGDESQSMPDGYWRPASGSFDLWPRAAAKLRVLDPCCGSGHFLVEGFELLLRLRMEEESLPLEEAIRAVLRDNLFGLEIDPRCTQIAAFNLALAAWKRAGRWLELPPLNIAYCGIAPDATQEDWLRVARRADSANADMGDDESDRRGLADAFMIGLTQLQEAFRQAPVLGSLIDLHTVREDLIQKGFDSLREPLDAVLAQEEDDETTEQAIAAQGMTAAADIMTGTYTLVITNVPYLARGKQSDAIKQFADREHKTAKNDLATMFVSRIFEWLGTSATQAVVTPQNWLFLKSYQKLREQLLKERAWNFVARLGAGAFETIGGQVVNVALNILSAHKPEPDWQMAGMDVSAPRGQRLIRAAEKAELLRDDGPAVMTRQAGQLHNPDAVVRERPTTVQSLLRQYCDGHQGLATADYSRRGRCFWESPQLSANWKFQQSTVQVTENFGGREHVVYWGEGDDALEANPGVRVQGGGGME